MKPYTPHELENPYEDTQPEPTKRPDYLRFVFRVSALSVSVISTTISAWFSFGSIARHLPVPVAVVLSCVVVSSATLAPELVILLARKRRFFSMIFVSVVGLVASAYSMTTTIAGQYDAREKINIVEIKNQRGEDERARIIKEIERLNVSIDTYQIRITRATNDGITDGAATTLKKQDETKKEKYEKMLITTDDIIQAPVRDSFYFWVGRITGIDGNAIEFSASVLPALLLDISAPVFAVVFLVL